LVRLKDELHGFRGISIEDFSEYEGLFQTLNPAFYEIALNKSLENLGLEMIDVYYIHIPEITKLKLTEDEFYEKMEMLIRCMRQSVLKERLDIMA